MNAKTLSVDLRSSVLYITLNTPSCAVNIFNAQLGLDLLDVLGSLDGSARAVVVESAKPDSFLNGASLMMASAVSTAEAAPRSTSAILRAYQAFEDLEIPSITAIRGNCYGCGVEFALRARYRVAADSYDTHFYMTELAEYLLLPAFGAPHRLPRMVGLEPAVRFLLWGERWSASEALSQGLVDGCFPVSDFEEIVGRLAADLARDGRSSLLAEPRRGAESHGDDVRLRARERIGSLPPAYRGVYTTCFDLMEQSMRSESLADDDSEMVAALKSAMAPIARAAITYFFVSQTCDLSCLRGSEVPSSFRVNADGAEPAPRFLRDELQRRRLRDVTFHEGPETDDSPGALRFVAYPGTTSQAKKPIAVADALCLSPLEWAGDVVLYAPVWRRGSPFVEIACREVCDAAQATYRLLLRAGVRSIITRPSRTFAINDLMRAYLWPQVAFLQGGGAPTDLGMTLVDFGFVALPGDWLPGWDLEAVAALLAGDTAPASVRSACREALQALPRARDASGGTPNDPVRAAVLVSLMAFARQSLESGVVSHPSLVDVAAREVVDFPLGHASLCRYGTAKRARELLETSVSFSALAVPAAIDALKGYADNGKNYYR
jgi:enoyl-CoA hydratase/carnithine racemase